MTNTQMAIVFLLCGFVCFLLQKLPLFRFLWKLFAAFYIALLLIFVAGFVKTKIKNNFFK
jgi:hypothetical protein